MSISEGIFLRKMEVVNLRTHWDMQKVSTASQKVEKTKFIGTISAVLLMYFFCINVVNCTIRLLKH